MEYLCIILCLTFLSVSIATHDSQQVELRDIQDYLERLTEQLRSHRTRAPDSTIPQVSLPRYIDDQDYFLRTEEEGPPLPLPYRYPQNADQTELKSFASAAIKRPRNGIGTAEAVAYSSVKEVNDEEHLGEEPIESFEPFTTTTDESIKESTSHETLIPSYETLSSQNGPTTLKRQQDGPIMKEDNSFSDVYFVAIVAGCCAAGIFGIISAGFCFYRLQKHSKAAAEVEYPAYGMTGPSKDAPSPNGDRKLAQSAQMYHYQHQKQQMIAVEKAGSTKNTSASDVDSEEENEEGEYTVYECPGLAPTEEMEVKNPLFHDDSTPVSPPILPNKSEDNHQ